MITTIILSLAGILYCLIIGLFTYGWYRGKHVNGNDNDNDNININERVSVIIAVKNEEEHICGLLHDMILQDYPKSLLEIIIVDDHSTDKTAEVVSEFIAEFRFPGMIILKRKEADKVGKKAALDFGINQSTGAIIFTTDADCRVGPGWVSALTACFRDEKIKMAFGPVTYNVENRLSDQLQSLEFSGLVASGAGAAMAGYPFLCNGACLAYRKEAYLQVKGFEGNEGYISGDDVFLLHKIKKVFGRKAIVFCKDKEVLVKTFPAPGIAGFISQRSRWASKSRAYRDFLSIATALIVFSYSLIVLMSLFAGLFDKRMFLFFMGLMMVKILADLPLIWGITGFTGSRKLLKWYLPFQVVYPFYIVSTGLLSLFAGKKWR
jgi:cellulose synthase/poly-beta-1,6-N-acetylglucosamine synthase-like glycosyltransferase